jgi:hypothetical protein
MTFAEQAFKEARKHNPLPGAPQWVDGPAPVTPNDLMKFSITKPGAAESIKHDTAPADSADSGQHYRYSYRGVKLDPYRIIDAYGITHPAQQHAIKKLLRAGKSVKSLRQDIQEVQDALTRWLEMLDEDQRA